MGSTVRGGTGATPAWKSRAREKRVEEEGKRLREAVKRMEEDEQKTRFDDMTVAELRVYAQEYDIPKYAKLKKAELVEKVRDAFEGFWHPFREEGRR